MFETFGFETLTAPQAAVWFGVGLGLIFGILAQISRFCLRRAIAAPGDERRAAAGVWLAGLAAAVLGTQAAIAAGLVAFDGHRFLNGDLPVLAILAGGLMFGAGMILARGCISRLTVLTGQGNLRALMGLVVFAVIAHATLKGVLAPARVALGSVTVPLGDAITLAVLPGGALVWTAALAASAFAVAARSGAMTRDLVLGAGIGLLATLGWVGTGYVLYDDFDPVALQSLSFTAPTADGLFWTVASTAIAPNFGVGLVGGVLLGAFVAATVRRRFQWESFENPAQTGRSLVGAALMGLGGVLAGGCTVGAGLSGVSTLSVAALLALAAIIAGGWVTTRFMASRPGGYAIPAE